MKAKMARMIRRTSQQCSQHPDGLGVSELFLSPAAHVAAILSARDPRLKRYLLGFRNIPPARC